MTLQLNSCTYAYRRWQTPVLKDFSWQLPQGLTILLGPNGAGKSTLLRLGAAVAQPRTGTVQFDGLHSSTKDYRKSVAWMPQNITPIANLTAREYVSYIGWLKGMNRQDAWEQAAQALRQVELAEQADTRTTRLSGGQLRRVGVAGALVHQAKVILLDEPTAGMDPRQRRVFRDILRSLTDRVSVMMSTHDVADLAEEADHVTVLETGQVLYTGDTAGFLEHTPQGTASGRAAEGAYTAILERT
ncbi:ABC transporter ATP-binding protein [Streptomyces sp. NPDC059371]|uniref:ABC transporter ATP-binding protein n=1 Tax=Streptomyces sp. NPDC059371 TaxID=3346812 RepID=UPI00368D99D2